MKRTTAFCLSVLLGLFLASPARSFGQESSAETGWTPLFNGKDLAGWKFRNPQAKNLWMVCDEVQLDPADPTRFLPAGDGGEPNAVLLCGEDGKSSDIMTDELFQDYELHLEFNVPKGSNSGVYNRGLFEIQIFDSYGAEALACHDCGSLYERAVSPKNWSRPPGQWQSFDITLKGKKISLVWNGQQVYRDMDVRYGETDKAAFDRLRKESESLPAPLRVSLEEKDGRFVGYFGEGGTRSGLAGPDRPGPILLQGDHGPVAYRNLRIKRLPSEKP